MSVSLAVLAISAGMFLQLMQFKDSIEIVWSPIFRGTCSLLLLLSRVSCEFPVGRSLRFTPPHLATFALWVIFCCRLKVIICNVEFLESLSFDGEESFMFQVMKLESLSFSKIGWKEFLLRLVASKGIAGIERFIDLNLL
ncbi:hypothetical protein PIB30_032556 [Stylosanthes scabra]|uniref:Uncharacterized protein n=1 Tax=Stylosanthes scabra TaxID=79078 RepID=A0ABU6QBQ3_9FABA|nr:hypothetical protein [Stylosanthes scabra]